MGELLREVVLKNQISRVVWRNPSLNEMTYLIDTSTTCSFLTLTTDVRTENCISYRFFLVNRYQGTFCKIFYLYNPKEKTGSWVGDSKPFAYRSITTMIPDETTIHCEIDFYSCYYDMINRLPLSAKSDSRYRDEIRNRMRALLYTFTNLNLGSFLPKECVFVADDNYRKANNDFRKEWLRICADSFDSFTLANMTEDELMTVLLSVTNYA